MAQQDNNAKHGKHTALSRPRASKSPSSPPPSRVSKSPSSPPPSKVSKPARPSLSFHSTYDDDATRVYLGRSNEFAALDTSETQVSVLTDLEYRPSPADIEYPSNPTDVEYLPKRQPTVPQAENPFTRPRLPTMPTQNTDSCAPVAFPQSDSTGSLPAVSRGATKQQKLSLIIGGAVTAFAAAAALFIALPRHDTKTGAAAQHHVDASRIPAPAPMTAQAYPIVEAPAEAETFVASEPVRETARAAGAKARPHSHALPKTESRARVETATPTPKAEPVKVEAKSAEPKPEKRPPQLPIAGTSEDEKPSKNSSKAEKDAMARAKATAAEAEAAAKNEL
jgi:hypothetical protein